MTDEEHALVDASGDYRYVVRDGEPVVDGSWRACRIVLTDERLVLATNDQKRSIAIENVRLVEEPASVIPDGVSADGAVPLRIGDAVVLLDAGGVDDLETAYCRAVLHEEVILAKPAAVVGGVVDEDAEWTKARFRLEDDKVVVGLAGGGTAGFDVADVDSISQTRSTVLEAERLVLAVEHTDDEDRIVETRFSGTERHVRALSALLSDAVAADEDDVELNETDQRVLMALYSGVSPFEMADFVGLDVDEVEAVYERLIEAGAVDKVRERTEVALNATGRNLASEAMNED